MSALKSQIEAEIRENGPISIARYMTLCLQHPTYGYYIRKDPLGARGDFTTAPEISQMFGEMLGLWAAAVWQSQGGGPIALTELGPGRGTLMADILRTARQVPGFLEALKLQLVETSPALRKRQQEALKGYPVAWYNSLAETSDNHSIIIGNEFVDALPVRQFQRDQNGWRERVVGLAPEGLAIGLAPIMAMEQLDKLFSQSPVGTVVEWRDTQGLMTEIHNRICDKGAALLIDYGDWNGSGDTLQALKAHQPVDPFAEPGEADLTSHVNFSHLAHASLRAQFDTQGAFLERLGITTRAQILAHKDPAGVAAQHRRLTHPQEMGALFKVLALTPPDHPKSPGFAEVSP